MRFIAVSAISLLASLATAKKCMNATVIVDVSTRTGVFGNVKVPQTNSDATAFIQNLAQQGRNYTAAALTGYQTTAKSYNISTQFCTPDNDASSNPTVQVLTHGIGFDKTYWDLPFNNFNYSYVDAVTNDKYCTLSYDRLGIGNSSHGEPRDEIQASLEIAALYELTMMLRNGKFPGVPKAFTKTVHVGHSFGSAQTYALANMYPSATDAIVLTGFSMNSSFVSSFLAGGNFMQANMVSPLRFGNVDPVQAQSLIANSPLAGYAAGIDFTKIPPGQNLPNGYLISGNSAADQLLFFEPGNFDPMIAMAAEPTKQPVTVGELLTVSGGPMMNMYAGPVLVITGQNDVPFCGGDCLATGDPSLASIPAAAKMNFPKVDASNFTAYIQPNTGHGINLHYNASGAYGVIDNFIASKGLATS